MDNKSPEPSFFGFPGIEIYRKLAKSLKSRRRRWILYFLLFMVATAVLLDIAGNPFSDLFGVSGCGGIIIYMGVLLLLALPKEELRMQILYRLLALAWIIIGAIAIATFLVDWLLNPKTP